MAATENATPTQDASAQNAPSATTLAMVATLHPTAKGTTGESDPSTDRPVEEVATPDATTDVAEADAMADGATSDRLIDEAPATQATDAHATATQVPATQATDADAVETAATAGIVAQPSAQTSGQVDAFTQAIVDGPRAGSAEQVVGAALAAEDTQAAALDTDRMPSEAAAAISNDGADDSHRLDAIEAPRLDAPMGSADAAADESPIDGVADGPAEEAAAAAVVDRPAAQVAAPSVNRSNNPDSVVVLAREVTAATEAGRTAPTTPPPTSGPMAEAEANLWEDVRSAFDRIRSTGDGQEVRIRLRPAELGELLVQVRTQGEHVSVKLVASSAAAQQTLVDDRLRLAAELARAGFEEGSVDIGHQEAGDSNRGDADRGDGRGADRSAQSLRTVAGLDRADGTRQPLERRAPIRTESGFRPGRTAFSTINLTL